MSSFTLSLNNLFKIHNLKCLFIRRISNKATKKFPDVIKGEILVGFHSVRLALDNPRRKINRIFYSANSDRIGEIVDIANLKGVQTKERPRKQLSLIAATDLHRGVCADAEPLLPLVVKDEDSELERLSIDKTNLKRLWLLLCGIGDPHNLGAIVRTAYFMGVEKVFLCSPWDGLQASSPLTGVSSRTSAGVVEIFTPTFLLNPYNFLSSLDQNGWDVVGAMPRQDDNQSISKDDFTKARSKILVIGNEGQGLTDSIVSKCNKFECIQSRRELHPCVDSLNVSVATALLIQKLNNHLDRC